MIDPRQFDEVSREHQAELDKLDKVAMGAKPRLTLQEHPVVITDEELEEAKTHVEKGLKFRYVDLLDNFTLAEEDLKFVTDQAKIDELKKRISLLDACILISRERIGMQNDIYDDYKEGMSFNKEQRFFTNIFGGVMHNIGGTSNDYLDYIWTKEAINEIRDNMLYFYMSDNQIKEASKEFMDMTVGEAFEKFFPQTPEK